MKTQNAMPYTRWSRRHFIRAASAASVLTCLRPALQAAAPTDPATPRRMRLAFTPGSIGVRANFPESVRMAREHGFEAVEPNAGYLAGLSDEALQKLRTDLERQGLTWAAAGFPVQFRQDDAAFQKSLADLPAYASSLQRAGVTRIGTWISPGTDRLTYMRNFRQHAARLGAAARALDDHGLRLGLEYVGTRTSWTNRKYPFIHTMAETLDLIAEAGAPNLGLILDSWHWWQAGDTVADILALKNSLVVSVDLNDAPAGIPLEQQLDGQRELPAATGVIDLAGFLNALQQIGYDGPVRAEPFNRTLNDLDNEAACAACAQAMKKAFALIR